MRSWIRVVAVAVVAGAMIFGGMQTVQAADLQAKVKEAMGALQAKCNELGAPKLDGDKLLFGDTVMNDSTDVVDAIAAEFGSTATLFAAEGDGFKRIATNVVKPDGSRAVGTMLDPAGTAIQHISKGEAFYGTADILGAAYETGYEPIKDASGAVIGIYYVGFKK